MFKNILFKHIWKLWKIGTLNSIKKVNIPTICHFLFHTIVRQYTQSRIHRLKIRNIYFFNLYVYFLLDLDSDCRSMRVQIHNTARKLIFSGHWYHLIGARSDGISDPIIGPSLTWRNYLYTKHFYSRRAAKRSTSQAGRRRSLSMVAKSRKVPQLCAHTKMRWPIRLTYSLALCWSVVLLS